MEWLSRDYSKELDHFSNHLTLKSRLQRPLVYQLFTSTLNPLSHVYRLYFFTFVSRDLLFSNVEFSSCLSLMKISHKTGADFVTRPNRFRHKTGAIPSQDQSKLHHKTGADSVTRLEQISPLDRSRFR